MNEAKTVTFERETSVGTTLRVTLQPLEPPFVRILEYYRKPKTSERFKRVRSEEGAVLSFEQLGIEASFAEFFSLKEAA